MFDTMFVGILVRKANPSLRTHLWQRSSSDIIINRVIYIHVVTAIVITNNQDEMEEYRCSLC